jgi:hypothetical protein
MLKQLSNLYYTTVGALVWFFVSLYDEICEAWEGR